MNNNKKYCLTISRFSITFLRKECLQHWNVAVVFGRFRVQILALRTDYHDRPFVVSQPPSPPQANAVIVLQRMDPLLGNESETNDTTAVTRQQPACQWPGWKVAFPPQSAPMAVHGTMETMAFSMRSVGKGAIIGTNFRWAINHQS
jgi:hypothetical protein